jgi:hypothetical protein
MNLRKEFETLDLAMEFIADYDLKYPENPYFTRYKLWHCARWVVDIDRADSAD